MELVSSLGKLIQPVMINTETEGYYDHNYTSCTTIAYAPLTRIATYDHKVIVH